MVADLNVTANDVARAEVHVDRCKKAWEDRGCRLVSPTELTEIETRIAQRAGELRQLLSPMWKLTQLKFITYFLIEPTGAVTLGWLVSGLIAGTLAVVLAAVPMVLIFGQLLPVLLALAICFFLASSSMFAIVGSLAGKDISREISDLRLQLKTRSERIHTLHTQIHNWQEHLSGLENALHAQEEYEQAVKCHDRLVSILNSRRCQLLRSDWRSLRDTDFENFVAEIFEELGFVVEKTKASGDQGVDLIVTGQGRKIAIQTKGYKGSVGNGAIQEVYAGMTFYNCRECVAVTNSFFTRGAKELASSVGCHLIDGQGIPRLIEGEGF